MSATPQNVVAGQFRREPEAYVTRRELAGMMRVSEATISRWVRDGMPSETWGARFRLFLPSQAMAWARERRTAA